MARTIKSGKELSFHKATKRWYKTHQGKPYYFGSGTSVRDKRSYEAARQLYYLWKEKRETTAMLERIQGIHQAVLAGQIPVADLGTSPWAMRIINDFRAKGHINEQGFYDPGADAVYIRPPFDLPTGGAAATFQPEVDKPKRERTRTIRQRMDEWLAEEQTRVDAGQLSQTAHRDKDNGLKTMREYVSNNTFGKQEDVEKLCIDYRQWLMQKVAAGDYTANTCNDKTKFAGQFIEWCWKRGYIKEPPRTLAELRKKLHTEKAGKPLTVEQIQKLWKTAGPRMKCFIAIGLNCAFKPGDITALKGKNLQDGRLLGIREKTKKSLVPYNYVLWPITQKLIKKRRDRTGEDELIFVNTKGERISTSTFSSLFRNLAKKAGVTACFEQLRDTSANNVKQALFKNGGDLGLLQVFLAHKDKSTAQYYVSDDPAHLKSPKLDKIVRELQNTYGL